MTKLTQMSVALLIALFSTGLHSETIEQVLTRSTAERLSQMQTVDVSTVPQLVQSFHKIRGAVGGVQPLIMLKVIQGADAELAMTDGRSVVIHMVVEQYGAIQRDFLIAHEIGHIMRNHRDQQIALYQKYYPGEVTEQSAVAVNNMPSFGREMRALSHNVEFEADGYALRTLVGLGWSKDDVINAFLGLGRTLTTVTHPSSFTRAFNMRNIDVQEPLK